MGFGGIREPSVKDLRLRPKRPRCCGCKKQMTMRDNETRPICARCRRNPSRLNKAIVAWNRRQELATIRREAKEATKNLKPGKAFNPLLGEKMILKMLRGEDPW